MLKIGTFKVTLPLPSRMCSTLGITGAKSRPGFAVPDSVHHVKLASPCRLPLRRTVTRASRSLGSTSTVSAAISTRIGPALPARADVPLVGAQAADAAAAPGLGVGAGGAAAIGAEAVRAAAVGAATVGAATVGAATVGAVAVEAVATVAAVGAVALRAEAGLRCGAGADAPIGGGGS